MDIDKLEDGIYTVDGVTGIADGVVLKVNADYEPCQPAKPSQFQEGRPAYFEVTEVSAYIGIVDGDEYFKVIDISRDQIAEIENGLLEYSKEG